MKTNTLNKLKVGGLVITLGLASIVGSTKLAEIIKEFEFKQIQTEKKEIKTKSYEFENKLMTLIYNPTSMWLDGGTLSENLRKEYNSGLCPTCNSFEDYLLTKICESNSYWNSLKRQNTF
ncbi:MAG: hypothetical protein KC550_00495 [Nanoarchaeota archaeon]|nr:hypothetical protein [Nanoarchaeota archaeon]